MSTQAQSSRSVVREAAMPETLVIDPANWTEPERKRHLWRLWLVCDGKRPQIPYQHHWENGVHGEGTEERVVLG